jgi:hypothetical protein
VTIAELAALFRDAGCKELYAKPLAENDNSKNQVYFGPGFEALNLFPNEGIFPDSSPKNPIFKAKLRFSWLLPNGTLADAPRAQLILYPQYPEVRFSGFLHGSSEAPSELMRGRTPGRVLFLGVTAKRTVVGFVAATGSPLAAEFSARGSQPSAGVFHQLPLPQVGDEEDARTKLLAELRRINRLGWIESKQLAADGRISPCNAPQCGGLTLEAELGIPKNSSAEPDFLGWEIKQHSVSSFERVTTGVITLMTPEPTAGFYRDCGVEAFIRTFGYADRLGRRDRMNFGGIHRVGTRHPTTKLTMTLNGFDRASGRITDIRGHLALLGDDGQAAAVWPFAGLLEHWSRKHAKAVYVPSQCRKGQGRQYHYGHRVRLAQRTDSLRLLRALAKGDVYYDPGIKLENVSSARPVCKRRSQFRIASKSIAALYESVEVAEL